MAGMGGIMGTGGNRDAGSISPDAGLSDATRDTSPADTLGPDIRPADGPPDLLPTCKAEIDAVVPTKDWLGRLVAGPYVQVVLRATVLSGGEGGAPNWTWQGTCNGLPLPPAGLGQQDTAEVAFPIANAGDYQFTATDVNHVCNQPNAVKVRAYPLSANDPFDSYVWVRAAPPPSSSIPVQEGSIWLHSTPPFADIPVVLFNGATVSVQPSVGGNDVVSYVRINNIKNATSNGQAAPPVAELVAEGMADQNSPFNTPLIAVDSSGNNLHYDVLVVPLDGTGGGSIAATAPQLFPSLTTVDINNKLFNIAGGLTVTGAILSAGGKAVADARVVLTNQDPMAAVQPHLIFSSVGSSDDQGNYQLHVQPGSYWLSVSPPSGAGLSQAQAPTAIPLNTDATLGFEWDLPTTASVNLTVIDSGGAALSGASVRLTSAEQSRVGTLTISPSSDGVTTQVAAGNVQVQGTTSSSGVATFSSLPANSAYDLLLMPATLGPQAATTTLTLRVGAGTTNQTVQLWPQAQIDGRLVGDDKGAPDWTQVVVVAYDKSADSPEAPRGVTANSDGSFSLGVSPWRPYVIQAVPPAGSGWARTFVGPGPLQASEFTVTQKVQRSMSWSAVVRVQGGTGTGLVDTPLQVLCDASWPYCLDPTIPLAETTSGDGGSFQLDLPDPATR